MYYYNSCEWCNKHDLEEWAMVGWDKVCWECLDKEVQKNKEWQNATGTSKKFLRSGF